MKATTNQNGKAVVGAVLAIVVLAVLGGAFYWYTQNSNKTSETAKQEEPGQNLGGKLKVDPIKGNDVSGTISITLTEVPEGTKMVGFVVLKNGENVKDVGPKMQRDTDESDGWTWLVDTTAYENGLYEISALPSADADSNPLSLVKKQIMIKN